MSELPIGPRRSARYRIIRSMEKELMGPTEIDERFEEYPSTRYIVGRLSPANEPIDAEEDDGLGVGCDDGEGGYDEKEMPLIMGFHPSSMGISFELDSNEYNLKVEVEWADYKFEEDEEEGGQSWRRYQRKGLVENIAINSDGRLPQIPLHPDSAPDGVTISGLEDKEITLDGLVHKKDDYQTVSLFLVNRRERGDIGDRTKDEKWIFQPKITIHDQNEQSIFSSKGLNNIVENEDPEIAEQDLLYRHAKVFATGHGVSADWEDSNEGEEKTSKIWTEFIPKREIPSLIALESQAQGTLLDMKELSQLSSGGEIYEALIPMLNAYKEWIEKQKQLSLDPQIQESVSLKDAANLNLELCEEVYKRMLRGLEHIRDNNNVAEAFKFSNEAMWRQRIQSILAQINSENGTRTASFEDNDIRKNRTWRPFQMGFFLINILGLSYPVDQGLEERKMVDLLWFPTGGGKTEAYLGISAFVLGLRRLKGDQDGYVSGAGTSIIMRYTLRLLTVQQFQRTTALVCACESIRRLDSQKWGQEPFQIGLWVGRNTTPNDFLDSRKALQLLSERRNLKEGSPVQILSCPWCGEQLSDIKGRPLSGSYSIDDNSARTIISCLNPDCEFCRRRSEIGIPAVVVDDEIYRVCPSIIIGTVDKFARLPFKGEIKSIFGRRNRYSPTLGHLSDADTKIRGRVVRDAEPANPLLPPELIIQDELHLISGPLGSIVGLYESAIDMLTQINGVSAKIIASTATIRRAKHQVRRLYNSGLSIFPQSGINSTDSFFAKQRVINEEDDNSSGRMFLGINAPGSSTKTLLVRVYSVLLASAQAEIDENSDVADPYGTLVGYFNSLKALGGAKRLVEDDIKNVRLRYLYNQRGFPRKNITEPDELTSRLKSWQIPALLRKLNRKFPRGESDWPSDVLLATNMISVGVDINRLGLMVVTGQPRSTSEYIQASSRVGREHPGLVITMYNWLGARDISHYEKFRAYHDAIYRHVESMSITPFSSRAIDRGIQGLMVGLSRMGIDGLSQESQAQDFDPADPSFNEIVQSISTRAGEVLEDQQEAENLRARMLLDGDRWSSYTDDPLRYKWLRENMTPPENQRVLIKTAGTKNPGIWSALGSLRDVESQSAFFLNEFIQVEGEDQ